MHKTRIPTEYREKGLRCFKKLNISNVSIFLIDCQSNTAQKPWHYETSYVTELSILLSASVWYFLFQYFFFLFLLLFNHFSELVVSNTYWLQWIIIFIFTISILLLQICHRNLKSNIVIWTFNVFWLFYCAAQSKLNITVYLGTINFDCYTRCSLFNKYYYELQSNDYHFEMLAIKT